MLPKFVASAELSNPENFGPPKWCKKYPGQNATSVTESLSGTKATKGGDPIPDHVWSHLRKDRRTSKRSRWKKSELGV